MLSITINFFYILSISLCQEVEVNRVTHFRPRKTWNRLEIFILFFHFPDNCRGSAEIISISTTLFVIPFSFFFYYYFIIFHILVFQTLDEYITYISKRHKNCRVIWNPDFDKIRDFCGISIFLKIFSSDIIIVLKKLNLTNI